MYPWLGLSLYEGESGIEVVEVIPGGPLDGFPLSPGDVITSIDGRRVHTLREAQRVLLDLGPGTLVSLDYLHEDKPGRIITALGNGRREWRNGSSTGPRVPWCFRSFLEREWKRWVEACCGRRIPEVIGYKRAKMLKR